MTWRSDRRRRWLLRAWAAVGRPTPADSVLHDPDPPVAARANWFDRAWETFRQHVGVPSAARLRLATATGDLVTVPLSEPYLLVGAADGCGLQLHHPAIADRQLALCWLAGELWQIDLASNPQRDPQRNRPLLTRWTDRDRGRFPDGSTLRTFGITARSRRHATDQSPQDSAPTAAPQARLVWTLGQDEREQPLRTGLALIGADPRCAIVLPARHVAPVHAVIVRTAQSLWIVNLTVDNLPVVNGVRRTWFPLDPGDELMIGSVSLRVLADWQWTEPVPSGPTAVTTEPVSVRQAVSRTP